MASGKAQKSSKPPLKNPKTKPKRLGPNKPNAKVVSKTKKKKVKSKTDPTNNKDGAQQPSASQQLSFFLSEFQSANGVQLSSLELESIKETCFLEVSRDMGQDVTALGKQMMAAFGPSWKENLCKGHVLDGKIDVGSPAVLVISASALRSIELLRGVRSLTKECHAVKLFSKHMKVEEQVALLKSRVNFASGTPSRIKKLIDIEVLGLSRLAVIVLDMHADVKGYSLLTLPQVRDEFWDLYKNYFHQLLVQGDLRICLYGPLPTNNDFKGKRKRSTDE